MMVFGLMALGWRGLQPVARPPVHVFVGVDRSLSAEPQLGQYAHVLADLAASLEEQDQLTLYRFDYKCQEFYDDHPPNDIEHFKGMLIDTLRPAPTRRGTRQALFYETVSDRLQKSPMSAVVVVLTDGGNDDANTLALYRKHARQLAENDSLKRLVVMGALPAQRQELRDVLDPLGPRLELYGPQDIGVERLLSGL